MGTVPNFRQIMDQITKLNEASGQLTLQSSLIQSQVAYKNAQVEYMGTMAQLQIDQISTAANVVADVNNLAARNATTIAGKTQEMQQFMAQYREKMLGLFISIQESRAENTWGRIKKISQGFKF